MTVAVIPSLGALQALSALARNGSLTAAATRLGVTRSALSHRIADLEAQFGVALVRRDGRGVRLTEEGETLIASLGDSIARIESAIDALQRRRLQVRVSTVATFASGWLLPRLPDFNAQHPHIEIAVATTTRPVDLNTESVDLAIRHGDGSWEGLEASLLFRETLIPVAAPGCIGTEVTRRDWSSAILIHARSRAQDWPAWWQHCGREAPEARRLIVENRAQALDAALAGGGIALVDAVYVEQLIANGRLRALADAPLALETGYYAVHLPSPRNAHLVFAFRDWLRMESAPFRACDGLL